LPKPIRRVLTARVEATGAEGSSLKALRKPLLVARPEPEQIDTSEQAGSRVAQ
jgi:hypothetical protein